MLKSGLSVSLIRTVQPVGLGGFKSLIDVIAVQSTLKILLRPISLSQVLTCALLLTLSHTAFASEYLNIKVTKPIKVDYKAKLSQSLKFEQVKLLHKDKTGICWTTRDINSGHTNYLITLRSNVGNISIDDGVISAKNTKLVEEHSIESVMLYYFDLLDA